MSLDSRNMTRAGKILMIVSAVLSLLLGFGIHSLIDIYAVIESARSRWVIANWLFLVVPFVVSGLIVFGIGYGIMTRTGTRIFKTDKDPTEDATKPKGKLGLIIALILFALAVVVIGLRIISGN